MKFILGLSFSCIIALSLAFSLSSCNGGDGKKTFCDTACKTDSFDFKGDAKLGSYVKISLSDCKPDSIYWSTKTRSSVGKQDMAYLLDRSVKLNPSAISCAFLDTTNAWVSFNDCITGRGYMLIIDLKNKGGAQVIKGALNSFDPTFKIDPDLRAYTDRGNLFVVNVKNGKKAEMAFDKVYNIDFDKIHEYIKEVNITKTKFSVVMIDKDGKEVPLSKDRDVQ